MNLYVATGPIFICKEQQSSQGLSPISKYVFHHALNKLEFSRPPGALDRFPAWLLVDVGRRTWLLLWELLLQGSDSGHGSRLLSFNSPGSDNHWLTPTLLVTEGRLIWLTNPLTHVTKFGLNGCSWCIYLMFTTVSSGLPRPKKVLMQKMQQCPSVERTQTHVPKCPCLLWCCRRVVYMFQNSDSVFLVWSPPTSEDLGLISIFHRFPMRGWKSGLVMINWPPLSPECCSPYMKEILLPSWQCNTITIITSNT